MLDKLSPVQIAALIYGKTDLDPIEHDKIDFQKKLNDIHDSFQFEVKKPQPTFTTSASAYDAVNVNLQYSISKCIGEITIFNFKQLEAYLDKLNILVGQFPHLKFLLLFKSGLAYDKSIHPEIIFLNDFIEKYTGVTFEFQNLFTEYQLKYKLRENLFTLTEKDLKKIDIINYFKGNENIDEVFEYIKKCKK